MNIQMEIPLTKVERTINWHLTKKITKVVGKFYRFLNKEEIKIINKILTKKYKNENKQHYKKFRW